MPSRPPGGRSAAQSPKADDAGAEEWRGLDVAEHIRDRVSEGLVHGHIVGIAAVEVPAGEVGVQAEILTPRAAEEADPAGVGQPGDPDAVTQVEPVGLRAERLDPSHHLMAGDDQRVFRREIALRQMEVGATDAADAHTYPDLPHPRLGDLPSHRCQGMGGHRPGDVDGPSPHQRCRHHRLPSLAHSNSAPPGLPPTRPGGKAAITSGRPQV